MGINTWYKPMKFALSIAIYLWTFGWILAYLKVKKQYIQYISWGIAVSMLVEISLIMYQAFRGVPSHFNFSTGFDSIIFGVMGVLILINTLIIILCFLLFVISKARLSSTQLLSVRLGFLIFIVGNFIGSVMIGNGAHSIGVADGGPGLPFLNWSTQGGDLRVAHLLGLHSIQIIPLAGFYFERNYQHLIKYHKLFIILFTMLYAAIFAWTYYRAMAGIPVIGL
ncbi:MAG: hypothetical protein R3250_05950 [Melioribacteraceae bacterium]|nr:hypothetical protein [Melioribacteraceae bacterium]